jgi:ATPase family associated with various cellular activities (AAA)
MRELLPDLLMDQVKEWFEDKLEDEKTLTRRNRSARQHLADAICLIFEEPLPPPVAQRLESVYIPRPDLEAQFAAHVEAGAKLIVFHGLPGMGKTWLARAAAASQAGAAVPEISIGPSGIDTASLISALRLCQVEVEGPPDGHERKHLAALLSDEKAPAFLLIDNLDSADDLGRLLPPLSNIRRTVVVATCRVRSEAIPGARFIAVGTMSSGEAETLIRSGVNHLSQEEAAYLAARLDGYPLAIRFACRILRSRTTGVEEFCRAIKADVHELAGRARNDQSATIEALIVWMIALVRERDELAFELLQVICLVRTKVAIEDRFLRQFAQWSRSPGSATGAIIRRPFSPLGYSEAVAVLLDFGIVDQIVDEHDDRPPDFYYTMHSLVRAVLRSLFNETGHWALVAQNLLSLISHLLETPAGQDGRRDDLGPAFGCGLELLGRLLIDGADDEEVRSILQKHPWLAASYAAELLVSLDEEPFDEMHDEFIYDIPLRWYQWAVACIRQQKEWWPSDGENGYGRLMEIAERFGIREAEKA